MSQNIFTNMEDAPYKIGDTVQRLNSTHGPFKAGVTAQVTGFKTKNSEFFRVILGYNNEYGHDARNLKLIKSGEPIINNSYEIY